MTRRKKVIIGLRLEGVYGRRILSGILDYLDTAGNWDIRFAYGATELQRMIPEADGLLVDHLANEFDFAAVLGKATPAVRFNTQPSTSPENLQAFVHTDDGAIGFSAARYFLSLGSFRSFGFIPARGRRNWSEKRGRAFALYLRQRGHEVSLYETKDADATTDNAALENWIKELPKPTALFAAWDARAVEALEACRNAGVKVPQQAVLLGVDNDEISCEHTMPPLSSIAPDTERGGFEGARLLDLIMRQRRPPNKRIVLVSVKGVVERTSTRPPAPAAELVRRALAFIKSDATKGIRPDDVAKRLGVSRSLLDRRFRELEGKTVGECLLAARLSALASLVRHTRRPLAELTRESGFASVNSAKEIFKRHFGLSMRDYRKQ